MKGLAKVCLFFAAGLFAFGYDGNFDRSFYVNELEDRGDTNPGDGHADADFLIPGDQISLRAAIEEANALGGTTLITMGSGIYENTISALWIHSNIIIEGQGPEGTVIDAGHLQPCTYQPHQLQD
jgi:hypothetical protein